MKVVCSAQHRRHEPPGELINGRWLPANEVPQRAEVIREALGADESFSLVPPDDHGRHAIEAVHEPAMVRYLERAWREWSAPGGRTAIFPSTFAHAGLFAPHLDPTEPVHAPAQSGYWCFDTSTPIVAGTYEAAREAADIALTTADQVLEGEAGAYGLCRPPGHHAARAVFGGFCYFNNAAIAAEHLVVQTGERVAVLDLDFHHGNGTQAIFYDREEVLYVSLHGDPARQYPYLTGTREEVGHGGGRGENRNLPLPERCDDATYLAALEDACDTIAGRPGDVLVVSLGFDTHQDDPLGDLALTTAGYSEVGRRVAALGRRLVVLQEGGYHLPSLGDNARRWLRGSMLPASPR